MIYCSRCGTKISDRARFCPVCGSPLHIPPVTPGQEPEPRPTPPGRPMMTPPPRRSGARWVPWTIIGVCLTGLLVILAFWYADIDSPWGHPKPAEEEVEVEEAEPISPEPVRSNYAPPQSDIARAVRESSEAVERPVEPAAKPSRIVCTGTVENEGKTYPIRIMVALHPNGTAVGRYAYESTLRRAGDNPSSWFKLNGSWNGMSDGARTINLTSINPADNQPFEDITISIADDNHFESGYFINKNVGSYHTLELNL